LVDKLHHARPTLRFELTKWRLRVTRCDSFIHVAETDTQVSETLQRLERRHTQHEICRQGVVRCQSKRLTLPRQKRLDVANSRSRLGDVSRAALPTRSTSPAAAHLPPPPPGGSAPPPLTSAAAARCTTSRTAASCGASGSRGVAAAAPPLCAAACRAIEPPPLPPPPPLLLLLLPLLLLLRGGITASALACSSAARPAAARGGTCGGASGGSGEVVVGGDVALPHARGGPADDARGAVPIGPTSRGRDGVPRLLSARSPSSLFTAPLTMP
jgi:hypothetical protein